MVMGIKGRICKYPSEDHLKDFVSFVVVVSYYCYYLIRKPNLCTQMGSNPWLPLLIGEELPFTPNNIVFYQKKKTLSSIALVKINKNGKCIFLNSWCLWSHFAPFGHQPCALSNYLILLKHFATLPGQCSEWLGLL